MFALIFNNIDVCYFRMPKAYENFEYIKIFYMKQLRLLEKIKLNGVYVDDIM